MISEKRIDQLWEELAVGLLDYTDNAGNKDHTKKLIKLVYVQAILDGMGGSMASQEKPD